jgi:hypothetical protein
MYHVLQFIYTIAHALIEGIQPVLVPLCFVVAWATIGFGAWSLWAAMRDSVKRAQQMHQIPCSDCQYFSGNYLLKCPLHPKEALSEAAIGCRDFESNQLEWPLPNHLENSSR